MEQKIERKNKDSTFARSYKYTGASSSSDKTSIRIKRRSVEQRDLRHDLIDQRRQIHLSPVNEGDSTLRDHSYKDKTPTKPKVDKRQAALQQAERLKLWKAEREEKRKQDLEKQKKAPFRFRKMTHKDQEVYDRKMKLVKKPSAIPPTTQSASVQIPVKKQPSRPVTTNNNKITTKQVKMPLPAKSYEKPTMGSKLKSTAETKKAPVVVNTRQTRNKAKDVKEQKPVPPPTRASRNSKHVPVETEKTARGTRQSARNKAVPAIKVDDVPEDTELNLTRVSTARGCTDSFAPDDFTFNTASFVFKPLSPNSAAGFLFPGQDTSCSFLDHNPKTSSTPYREKRKARSICKDACDSTMTESPKRNKRKKSSQQEAEMEETIISESKDSNDIPSTTALNDTVKLSQTPGDKQSNDSLLATALDETIQSSLKPGDNVASIKDTVEKPSTPLRRGSRRSVLSSSVVHENSENKEVTEKESSSTVIKSESRQVRRSTRSAVQSEELLEISHSEKRASRRSVSKEQTKLELDTSAKETKRGKRKSMIVSKEKQTIPETVPENVEDDAVFVSEPTEKDILTSDTEVTKEKSNKKTEKKEKFLSESAVENKKTPGRRGARNKSFAGFRLPDSQCVALSASAKRKRKSVMPKSPEEWVDLLSKSPMIEMTRRTPKLGNSSFTAIDFDDLDSSLTIAMNSEKTAGTSHMPADPKMNLFNSLDDNTENTAGKKETIEETETMLKDVPENPTEPLLIDKKVEISSTVPETSVKEAELRDVHDVKYFRKLLVTETDRLNSLCSHWEEVNKENTLTEEVSGQIRTTVGQGVLLMNQRFKQFRGLVDNCEFNTGEKETTCTDLDGFWDMIYFQVEDVDAKFEKLKKLQANNWVDDTPKPVVKKIKKKIVKPVITKPVKSKFAAFRNQMKKKVQSPGVDASVEEKVFEMPNFFAISSPVRSPALHCEAGSPRPVVAEPDNKEEPNKKQDSLSLPSSTEMLMKRTPARKSYAPVIPSPLLVDSTPKPRPSRSCTQKTPRQLINEDAMSSKETGLDRENKDRDTPAKRTPRRSIRARKSVNFTECVPAESSEQLSVSEDQTDTTVIEDDEPGNISEEKFVDDDVFARYLQPMSVLHGNSEKENSPTPAKRRKSSTGLKACPSSDRRKSQSKKVHFNSPAHEDAPSIRGSQTPFYKDSTEKRVTRRSLSQNVENLDTLSNENSPKRRKISSRPSLLYTPPSGKNSPARPLNEVPTGILISFTP